MQTIEMRDSEGFDQVSRKNGGQTWCEAVPGSNRCCVDMEGSQIGHTAHELPRVCKVLSDTEMKYGAPKAEMFAVVTIVEKYRAYLGIAPFKLLVDNRALSWLKTYSMDQSDIG